MLIRILLVTIFISIPITAQDEELNILFIGNSFTFRHELPDLVKTVIEEGQPGIKVNTQRVTWGGQSLYMHSNIFFSKTIIEKSTITDEIIHERIKKMQGFLEMTKAPEEYVAWWETVRPNDKMVPFTQIFDRISAAIKMHKDLLAHNPRTKWNYVVLQSWQDVRPSLEEGYAASVLEFSKIIKEQGAKIILYITAPNIQNSGPVTGRKLQEQVDLEMKLARKLANKVKANAVIPVPLALNFIQQGGTDYTFCYVNDFHPNQRTAFLTANMFYAALFNESTEGFKFNTVTETKLKAGKDPDGGDPSMVFNNEEKNYLQKIAYDAVMAFYTSMTDENQRRTNEN